jgi:hypothetical protein
MIRRVQTARSPSGINPRGDIVGSYFDSADAVHGFLLHQGKYTTIDAPKGVAGNGVGT